MSLCSSLRLHWIWISSTAFLILLISFSCSNPSGDRPPIEPAATKPMEAKVVAQELVTGKVIASILCQSDPKQSYSLYLPSNYSQSNEWPVYYVLDPHARGIKPVAKYQQLAEEFGCILVGSNVIKNGLSPEQSLDHFHIMLRDVKRRLSIAPGRQFAVGFSGGARVAVKAAIAIKSLSGAIGIGAGFPLRQAFPIRPFHYLAMVGFADFNFEELLKLDKALTQYGHAHTLLPFEGKHAWPEVDIARNWFVWSQLKWMEDSTIERNDGFVDESYSNDNSQLATIEASEFEPSYYWHLRKLESFYGAFKSLEEIVAKKAKVEAAYTQAEGERLVLENQMKRDLAAALPHRPLDWWEVEIQKMDVVVNRGPHNIEINSMKRLRAHLSLVAFLNATNMLSSNEVAMAEQMISVFRVLDPTNPDHYYLQALLLMKKGQSHLGLEQLQFAVEKGFDDWQRLENEPGFDPIRAKSSFPGKS